MLVCGVDEAGRGPMLGPMVVAGVAVSKSGARALKRAGVRDSKKLSPKARNRLYREILRIADAYTISRIQPHTIDRSVQRRGLNDLEASSMARIVSRLGADVSYVDSCDTDSARFGKKVSRLAGGKKVRSYHKADDRFAVVAAASILAKVSRDRAVARLGSVGSGYPADQHTRSHVRSYIKRHGSAPPYARKSWKPVKKMLERP